jgi:hypothetical protein
LINSTDNLNKSVNTSIETKQEIMILHALLLLAQDALPEKITGNIGRTQGASTVSIPAKNEIIIRSMQF